MRVKGLKMIAPLAALPRGERCRVPAADEDGLLKPHMCVDGVPVTRAKKQLRERVTNWLASHR
eukprot:4800708-Pyramimonas_sp.AAC.1